jgi:hypothetical protein
MGLFAMAQGFFLNPNPSCSYLTGLVCAGMSGLLRKALQALFDTIDLQLLAHFAPESLWSGRFRVIRQGRCMQRPYASPSAGLRYGRLRGASTLFLFLTFSKCPAVGTLHATSTKQSPKYPACSALFQKCPVVWSEPRRTRITRITRKKNPCNLRNPCISVVQTERAEWPRLPYPARTLRKGLWRPSFFLEGLLGGYKNQEQ